MWIRRLTTLLISVTYWAWLRITARLRQVLGGEAVEEAVVLYYHGVTDGQVEQFRRQMTWLSAHMPVLHLSNLHAFVGQGRCACVTFDDGFENVGRNAVPVLEALGVPATVYVVAGNLGRQAEWSMPADHVDAGEALMTGDRLRGLPPLIEIGSHTMTHPNLCSLDAVEVRRELADSREALERLLNRPVTTLSVPYGEVPEHLTELARQTGYQNVVTCEPEMIRAGDPPFRIGRFKTSPDDWMIEFRLKARGAYGWRRFLRRRPTHRLNSASCGQLATIPPCSSAQRVAGQG